MCHLPASQCCLIHNNSAGQFRMSQAFILSVVAIIEDNHIQSRVTKSCDADAVFTPFGRHHGQLVSPAFCLAYGFGYLRFSDELSSRSLTDTPAKTLSSQ